MLGMMRHIRKTQSTMEAIHRAAMVVEMTPQGYITSINANYLRFIGYDEAELLEHHHALLCSASYARHRAYYAFWQQLNKGISISGHFQRQTRSGRTLWIQATYTPITDAHGLVTRIVKIAAPVSEQLVSMVASQPPKDEDHAADHPMSTLTLSPGGTVTDVNEPFLALTGYARHQLMGIHYTELLTADDRQQPQEPWATSDQQPAKHHFRCMHTHGHTLSLWVTYLPVRDAQGHTQAIIMVSHSACIAEVPDTHLVHPLIDDARQMQQELSSLLHQTSALSHRIDHIAQQANLLSINSSVDARDNNEQGRELAQISQAMRRLSSRTAKSMHDITEDISMLSQLMQYASSKTPLPQTAPPALADPAVSAEELIRRVADTLQRASGSTRYVT